MVIKNINAKLNYGPNGFSVRNLVKATLNNFVSCMFWISKGMRFQRGLNSFGARMKKEFLLLFVLTYIADIIAPGPAVEISSRTVLG
jgi:hypothetical protein